MIEKITGIASLELLKILFMITITSFIFVVRSIAREDTVRSPLALLSSFLVRIAFGMISAFGFMGFWDMFFEHEITLVAVLFIACFSTAFCEEIINFFAKKYGVERRYEADK